MTAGNGIRGVPAARIAGPFQQLMTQGFQSELLHVLRRIQSGQGRDGVRRAAVRAVRRMAPAGLS